MRRARLTLLVLVAWPCACGSATTPTTSESSSSDATGTTTSGPPDPTTVVTTSESSSSGVADTTTDAPTTGDASSSSGAPSSCGNGDVDPDETCDDGNADDGDGCRADCTLPFEISWTVSHDGPASTDDIARDVLTDAAGNIYVVGFDGEVADDSNVWLQQYLPDGTEGWTYRYDGGESGDDVGSALMRAADGDFLIGGLTTSAGTGFDILLLRIDGRTRALEWETVADGSGSGPGINDDYDFADDIAFDPITEQLSVIGATRVDDQGWDMFVGKYDAAGAEIWTRTHDGLFMGDDVARGLLVDDDGTVRGFGNEQIDAMYATGLVLVFDADGAPQDGETQQLDTVISGVARDADGNFVLAGESSSAVTGRDIRVGKYDPSFAEIWAVEFEGSGEDFAGDVAVGSDGTVYVVGQTQTGGEQNNGILLAYDGDGNPLWSDDYDNDVAHLADSFTSVTVDPSGDVLVAGFETVIGSGRNALVRKYHPL